MAYKALPIGVDDFKKLRKQGYYYVDKTELIKELLVTVKQKKLDNPGILC